MFRKYKIAIFLLAIIINDGAYLNAKSKDNDKMVADLTIYLDSPILGGGGTVIIVPRSVDLKSWNTEVSGDNPAAKDDYLKSNKPLEPNSRRLGAIVSEPVSIVQFDYPLGGSFNFRFAPNPTSNHSWADLKTTQIGVGGDGQELDPSTREIINVGLAIHIHVFGKNVKETDSMIVESNIKIGALRKRYKCHDFERVLVCDAAKELIE